MKAIVTGATGFIGSWLTLELLKNNYDVTLILRNKGRLLPEISQNTRVSVIEKDIFDIEVKDFHTGSFDVCYHLAWEGVAPEQKNSISIQLRNIAAAVHMLEVCTEITCDRFIASGTVAEYSFCNDLMNLGGKQTPNDIYGAAKVSTYYVLEVRARQLGIPFNWIVLSSTFGERRFDNNIITYTIRTLLKEEKPQYGNLEQMWDFLYIGEAARAIRFIGERGKPNKVYGIGSGDYRQLRDFITVIRNVINPKLELGIGERPQMSIQTFSSCVNIFDLILDTGYKPMVSFEEGIARTVTWAKSLDILI